MVGVVGKCTISGQLYGVGLVFGQLWVMYVNVLALGFSCGQLWPMYANVCATLRASVWCGFWLRATLGNVYATLWASVYVVGFGCLQPWAVYMLHCMHMYGVDFGCGQLWIMCVNVSASLWASVWCGQLQASVWCGFWLWARRHQGWPSSSLALTPQAAISIIIISIKIIANLLVSLYAYLIQGKDKSFHRQFN